jgi:hypothetical protein
MQPEEVIITGPEKILQHDTIPGIPAPEKGYQTGNK